MNKLQNYYEHLIRIGWHAREAFNVAKTRKIFDANENVRKNINLERRKAFLTVRSIRDDAITSEEFSNGKRGPILSNVDKDAITYILEAIEQSWKLTDL